MAQARIARVRRILVHQLARYYVFLSLCTLILAVGAIFTSQNYPKCEFNSHFG